MLEIAPPRASFLKSNGGMSSSGGECRREAKARDG
jgi:hypothetical protein